MEISDMEKNLLTSYHVFHDGLSDMIEGGRLKQSDIPDDYEWLVDGLLLLAAHDSALTKAIEANKESAFHISIEGLPITIKCWINDKVSVCEIYSRLHLRLGHFIIDLAKLADEPKGRVDAIIRVASKRWVSMKEAEK